MNNLEIIMLVIIGFSLSATCGFRVFVPLLGLSIASYFDLINLNSEFDWMGTLPVIIAFSIATILEMTAYLIPWVDNALDAIASPVAIIAGIIVSASIITDMSPLIQWTLAVIVGGGSAGTIQTSTVALRGTSTATTGGFTNFLISLFEDFISIIITILVIIAPIIAFILILLFLLLSYKIIKRIKNKLIPN